MAEGSYTDLEFQIPFSLPVNHCPECHHNFVVLAIFTDEEEGLTSFAPQVFNGMGGLRCPYCGWEDHKGVERNG